MKLIEALTKILQARTQPIVTGYELFLMLRGLCRSRELNGERVDIRATSPAIDRFVPNLNRLIKNGVIENDQDFKSGVYRVIGLPDKPADELCCYVDPFCYISHLSAMQRHGITNRTPSELHLTSPEKGIWARQKSQKIFQDYEHGPDPGEAIIPLERIGFEKTVRGRLVRRHTSKYPGELRQVRGSISRVATVGQTFLDMLEMPEWCGGMPYVLEVWEEQASTFLEEIILAVDRSHTKLTKVRAGFILQEYLKLVEDDSRVEAWTECAQRGGSQRLDPDAPYAEVFSHKWKLSINV